MFTHYSKVAAFIIALFLGGSCFAHGKGRPRNCRVALGKMTRGRVHIQSWADRVVISRPQNTGDPWQATLQGYRRGSVVSLETQHPSAPIALPEACKGIVVKPAGKGAKASKGDARSAKLQRRQNSTTWRRAVSDALRYNPLRKFDVTVDSPKQQQVTAEIAEELAIHTPVRAKAKTADGRRYGIAHTNVAGKVRTSRREGNRTITSSGLFEPHYAAWAEAKNLFVTPVKDGKVRLLGLAAFPRGAKITVRNEHQGKATSFVAGSYAGRKERSGGDYALLDAKPGERLKIHVEFAAVANASNASAQTYYVEVPPSGRGKAAIEARGRRYFRAIVQPEHPRLDVAKLFVSPAMQCRGACKAKTGPWSAGQATLLGVEGAFSRGATVTVTNLRLKAEGSKEASVTATVGQSASGRDKIVVPAVFNDRLQVDVSYPGSSQPQTTIVNVPAGTGRPALREDKLPLFGASAQ